MKLRTSILAVAAVALAAMTTTTTQVSAQNKGQLVQAVAKLNAAQLAMVKRLADDADFAQQYETATGRGDYDTAAGLISAATGIAKSAIHVGPRGASLGHRAPGAAEERASGFQLATLRTSKPASSAMALSGKVCFNLGWVQGCVEF